MTLEEARRQLDAVDEQLVRVFLNRMRVSEAVSRIKAGNGQAVYAEDREDQILDRILKKAEEELSPEERKEPAAYMRSLMRHMMRISREYQYDLLMPLDERWETGRRIRNAADRLPGPASVAVQGGAGSYQSMAARLLYPGVRQVATDTWAESCALVHDRTVDLAVLPLENTTAGPVNAVYDLLQQHDLYIVASCTLPISHCLLAVPGTREEEITTVVSIPQALSQCAEQIRRSNWKGVASGNTAFAAREVAAAGRRDTAAIASSEAAREYGLEILRRDLNDAPSNRTRFVIVGPEPVIGEDAGKVSLILHLADRSGTLASVLNVFADRGLSLTKIQSRPMPDRPWEYSFYLDFDAAAEGELRRRALVTLYHLDQENPYVRFLGWYREHEELREEQQE